MMTQSMLMIPIMDIITDSIVDGEGLRDVLFVAGCPHQCKGCHNPESWYLSNAKSFEHPDDLFDKLTSNPLIDGITFSGGEPMLYAVHLLPLAQRIKEETNLTIWCWSGYRYEELIKNEHRRELLNYIDVLVDGEFVLELRDISENNVWRGSLNQRVLKLKDGEIVEEIYKNGYKGDIDG